MINKDQYKDELTAVGKGRAKSDCKKKYFKDKVKQSMIKKDYKKDQLTVVGKGRECTKKSSIY